MRKELSKAQQDHLANLVKEARGMQESVDRFVAYLRVEYETEGQEWILNDIRVGFVRVQVETPAETEAK